MDAKKVPPVVAQNAVMAGAEPIAYVCERPGLSTFVLEDGVVYHTYSTYARGLDSLWGMYQWLDRAPKGRNETGVWWRHHDRYGHDCGVVLSCLTTSRPAPGATMPLPAWPGGSASPPRRRSQ
jgi:hypothetical protein